MSSRHKSLESERYFGRLTPNRQHGHFMSNASSSVTINAINAINRLHPRDDPFPSTGRRGRVSLGCCKRRQSVERQSLSSLRLGLGKVVVSWCRTPPKPIHCRRSQITDISTVHSILHQGISALHRRHGLTFISLVQIYVGPPDHRTLINLQGMVSKDVRAWS